MLISAHGLAAAVLRNGLLKHMPQNDMTEHATSRARTLLSG